MPWLLPEPALALAEWRGRLHALTTHLKRQAAQYRAALRPDVTRTSTRNRLKLLAMACSDHARRLQALLAPLETDAEPAAAATYAALAPVVASAQGLASYYANVHRDWCWGDEENHAACEAVRRALGSAQSATGCWCSAAGRGGSPTTCTRSCVPTLTVAVDINPLLMAVARRMYAGERARPLRIPRRAARPRQPRAAAHAAQRRRAPSRSAARVRAMRSSRRSRRAASIRS